MPLFSAKQMEQINKVAVKSEEPLKTKKATGRNVTAQIEEMSAAVLEYFKDSNSILITTEKELHDYVDKCIEYGYAGIDTETTGLDRVNDYIVGASLYVPGMPDCYIPIKHRIPLFEQLYKDQLTYEQVAKEFERLRQVKLIFANADFDLAMIYKDIKVDFNEACYYDVIIAWRCLKENEKDNRLKALYNKYVLKGKGNPKAFSDFFTPTLFPYCKPEVAKLYAGNDAKITFELFQWQLPYITKGNPKCQKMHLEHIADLIWNVEFPLIPVCQNMHRNGMYLDNNTATMLKDRYNGMMAKERAKLAVLVQEVIDQNTYKVPSSKKKPFTTGASFNPESTLQVKYLLYDLLQLPKVEGQGTGKEVLHDINLPVTNQILKVRSLGVLISTFVDKMPAAVTKHDNRIHAEFKQLGADTGRLSCKNPNMMNIPSRSVDIRHMFRATPGYVMMSSDYSAQEPRLTAHVSNDPKMIQAFKDGKDIYASIASVAFGVPYEKCLEFHPETHEYQKDGKKRRGEAKTIVLGITYGRSIPSIADQLYGTRDDMTDEEKVKGAQHVYDAVLNSFPNLRSLMTQSQDFARQHGFVETILGRRRHLPDMQLPEFEFVAMPGYINPDIDPLDPSTLKNKSDIPERIVKSLQKEFKGYKYFGQIVKRTKQLKEEKIKVINNRPKINDATRQVVNSIIQGSAADQSKMAILLIENNPRWKEIGGRICTPVHDEIIAEVPMEHADEGAQLLSKLMCDAANFLPFESKCDVEITYRWYGLEAPCPYPKASCIDTTNIEEIKWIQYHLIEMEYLLPVIPDENGEARGNAAKGVSGVRTDEMESAIVDYLGRWKVSQDDFIDHIERKVVYGQ